jgi:hypothetical protein
VIILPNLEGIADFAVYIDRKPCGEPFYVGKGDRARVARTFRSRYHSAVVAKYPGCYRELHYTGTEDLCLHIEQRLIAHYGRRKPGPGGKVGPLINLTDGGEGTSGHVATDETRAKVSAAAKVQWEDPEYVAKNSAARKAKWQDPEYAAKNSAATKVQWQDPEYAAKMSAARKAYWQRNRDALVQIKFFAATSHYFHEAA